VAFCLFAVPAKRYAMTQATGIRSKPTLGIIRKLNSAIVFALNVSKSFILNITPLKNDDWSSATCMVHFTGHLCAKMPADTFEGKIWKLLKVYDYQSIRKS
jgi:hypothetical protein